MFFKSRLYIPEIMDDFSIIDERIDQAVGELKLINKYLGGASSTKFGLKKVIGIRNKELTILDIGAGGADAFNSISTGKNIKLFTLDKNIRAVKYLKKNRQEENVICGDAFLLPIKDKSFDVVHASLFLHHFSEKEITDLVKIFKKSAKTGIIINDLRRNIIAYLGIKILTTIFSKSEMVKNDAPLSVRKGFSRKELEEILRRQFSQYNIYRTWAFRWVICIQLN